MAEVNQKLKKSMKLFVEYFEELKNTKAKGSFLEATTRMAHKIRNKNLIMNFRNKPKSKNIDDFISHRIKTQQISRSMFENGMKIPFVLPLFSLDKSNLDEFKNLSDIVIKNSMAHMGCHNISDRISISNPKKFKSIRTMFSFPHMGLQNNIKELTKGEVYLSSATNPYEDITITKRLIDSNGKLWINHSINAIKDGSNWYKNFGEEGRDTLPITENNNSYSQEFYDKFGNDVFVDVDKLDFANMGIYHSLSYKYLSEFDFENFSEEELDWVEEWLDFEFIGLVFDSGTSVEPSIFNGIPNYGDDGKDFGMEYLLTLIKLGEEIGFSKLTPIVIDWERAWSDIVRKGGGYAREDLEYLSDDRVEDMVYNMVREYGGEMEHVKLTRNKIVDLMKEPPSDEIIKEKQQKYYKRFLEHTIDFDKKIIKKVDSHHRVGRVIRNNQRVSQNNPYRNRTLDSAIRGLVPQIKDLMNNLEKESN